VRTELINRVANLALASAAFLASSFAFSHGDVTPQAVDTSGLKQLGQEIAKENPYRGDKKAIAVGDSAYNQNCARCHGLEAVSGGIAPDLRKLDQDCDGLAAKDKQATCRKEVDDYFMVSVLRGKVRDGAVYMPPFEGILQQEAIWAIKAYVEVRSPSLK
jgi:cytochrome c-550 PedF